MPNACAALAKAQAAKGYSFAQIAAKIGSSEQHVANICSGVTAPSQAEFQAIAGVLGVSASPHATK